MKRRCLAAAALLCLLLGGCGHWLGAETVDSPTDAACKVTAAMERGQEQAWLRTGGMDEEELFRAVEAIWPYACTMLLTEYKGDLLKIQLDVPDQARQEQAETLAAGMARAATAGLSDERDKLRALHDVLVRSCVYDLETAEDGEGTDGASAPFTAYGALVDGKAVCAGYARAYMLLCRAAGLDAIYVADAEMNHSWNAVRLDGQTYFIDCTFDDPVPDSGEYVSHDYFLKTAEELSDTHTWERAFYERIMNAKWGN